MSLRVIAKLRDGSPRPVGGEDRSNEPLRIEFWSSSACRHPTTRIRAHAWTRAAGGRVRAVKLRRHSGAIVGPLGLRGRGAFLPKGCATTAPT